MYTDRVTPRPEGHGEIRKDRGVVSLIQTQSLTIGAEFR